MSAKRGFAHERDLARRLWELGFAVVRAPASGSKAKRVVYPDIVAIYRGRVVVAEVKTSRRERPIYIEKSKVEKLREFASRAGASAYVAVKIVGTGDWVFVPLEALEEAGSSLRVTREALNRGLKLEALVSMVKGVRKLSEFKKEGSDQVTT